MVHGAHGARGPGSDRRTTQRLGAVVKHCGHSTGKHIAEDCQANSGTSAVEPSLMFQQTSQCVWKNHLLVKTNFLTERCLRLLMDKMEN